MLKQFANISLNHTRNYAFKSHLKIKWKRPEKIPCFKPAKSGDLEPRPQIPNERIAFEFRKSKEIETADDAVKKLCSIGHQGHQANNLLVRQELLERVKRHKYDSTSFEARIAIMTGRIRCLQQHIAEFPQEKIGVVACKELIDKRKKFLKYLRKWDYKRFEWILERLSLEYKSPPSFFHWITRKESLVKLTDLHCEEIRKKKMAEYKASLIEQREQLLKEFDLDPSDVENSAMLKNISTSEALSHVDDLSPVQDKKV